MVFRSIFRFLLIFFTFGTWGSAIAAPLSLHDENRILNSTQIRYLEKLAQELDIHTGFSLKVELLDKTPPQLKETPKDDQIILLTCFRPQRFLVKKGGAVEALLPKEQTEQLQREYLIPEYKAGRYDRGILSLTYQLTKEIVQKKGGKLSLPPPESTLENHISATGWIFILLIFALLIATLFKKTKKKKNTDFCRRFKYGRFGWRLGQ